MTTRSHYYMIFLVALLIRLLVLHQLGDVDPIPTGTDMLSYFSRAQRLLNGEWPGPGVFYYHPIMPVLIAFSFKLFGVNSLSPQVLNCILGAVACPMLAVVGTKLFSWRVGVLSGWLLALYQGNAYYSTVILDVPLTTLALVAALWALSQPTPQVGVIVGLVLSLGILGRSTLTVTAITLVGWLVATRHYHTGLVILLTIALCLLPVIARNARYGRMAITSSGPLNLWIGNNPDANGTYNIQEGGEAHQRAEAVRRTGRQWLSQVISYVKQEPLDWLQLTLRKAAMFIALPDGFMPNNVNLILDGLRNSWLLRVLPRYWAFFILCFAGRLILRSHWRESIPLAVIYIPYAATTMLCFVLTRFRVPVTIIPIILSAILIIDIGDKLESLGILSVSST
jgi:hypothetical protein